MNEPNPGRESRCEGTPPAGCRAPGLALPLDRGESALLYAALLLMARHAHVAYKADGQASAASMHLSAVDLAGRVLDLADLPTDDLQGIRSWLEFVFPLPS